MSILEKLTEQSVEYDLMDFLQTLESRGELPVHAYTGGLAFGCYLGHLPRRLSDVDMVIASADLPHLSAALHAVHYYPMSSARSHVIAEFRSDTNYFDIDVHLDRIVLAMPGDWRVVGEYDLRPALASRQNLAFASLDRTRLVRIPVVSREEHFVMKLLPPLEAHNVHDILYLLCTEPWTFRSHESVLGIYRRLEPDLKVLLRTRLSQIYDAVPTTMWATAMLPGIRESVMDKLLSLQKALA
jgi:hypothetical protein